jgi:hypothetical protein
LNVLHLIGLPLLRVAPAAWVDPDLRGRQFEPLHALATGEFEGPGDAAVQLYPHGLGSTVLEVLILGVEPGGRRSVHHRKNGGHERHERATYHAPRLPRATTV